MTSYGIQTPADGCGLDELLALARDVDRLGYAWMSISDHLNATAGRRDLPATDSWDALVTLSAVAQVTRRIRCGLLVTSPTLRHPALLAKALITIDHLSGGRVEAGLGSGWLREEHEAFGMPFPGPATRLAMLSEAVAVLYRLLGHTTGSSVPGRYFSLDGGRLVPGPVAGPMPLWLGGSTPGILDLAARYGLGWNMIAASPQAYLAAHHRFAEACERAGRSVRSAPRSVVLTVLPADPAVHRAYAEWRGVDPAASGFVSGSDDAIVDQLAPVVEAGVEYLLLLIKAPDREQVVPWFATNILPKFA